MNRLDRQSFLGAASDAVLRNVTLGLVGLGGGGSHMVQQFAHMGVGGYVLVDPDTIEESNTNRLIGGTLEDVKKGTAKVVIAERLIRGLQPDARIDPIKDTWHNATNALKRCDIIIGAVDSFMEREQLERCARRHLINYIDIGMDVHEPQPGHYLIAGQVILSMPGYPCLRCCGFINDERIGREANNYGAAGGRPQVVWPNGVLASTAVGLATQLITPWSARHPGFTYLEYDGNRGTIVPSAHMKSLQGHVCPHHPAEETGDSLLDIRQYRKEVMERELARSTEAAPKSWYHRFRQWWS
jgi:hypothetical protein